MFHLEKSDSLIVSVVKNGSGFLDYQIYVVFSDFGLECIQSARDESQVINDHTRSSLLVRSSIARCRSSSPVSKMTLIDLVSGSVSTS